MSYSQNTFWKYFLKFWKNETRERIQKVALWKKYYISFAEIELQEIHFRAPSSCLALVGFEELSYLDWFTTNSAACAALSGLDL